MKLTFKVPTQYDDGSPIALADLATAKYAVFLDTVNPPIKQYPVPPALLQQTTGAITVDTSKDLGVILVPGTTYYVAMDDSVGGVLSDLTSVLTYVYTPKPNPPGNFSFA
jgi:hypothetical protein